MLDFLVGNDLLSAIVAFALILIPAVIVHELGHFLAAKAVGISVLEFGIGFPPRMLRLFRWGETEFTLNWIPIGGFVRPLGEDMIRPVSEEATQRDREQLQVELGTQGVQPSPEGSANGSRQLVAVNEAKPLPRIFFMAAGALANFLSAFLLFVVVGLIGLPRNIGGRVQLISVPANSVYASAGLQANDYIEEINGQKFTDSQDFFAKLGSMHGQQVTLTVDRLMPGQTASKGDIFDVTLVPGSDIAPSPREGYVRVVGVAKESPGDMAGLLPGDLIVGFNGESITGAQDPVADLQHLTAAHAGEKVTVSLLRKDQKLDLSLVPRANPPEGEGRMGIMIGVEYKNVATGLMYAEGPQQQMLIPQPLGASLQYGVERSLSVFSTLAEIPSRILSRNITPEEARPVSIVGISQWGGQVLQESIQDNTPITILNYIAMINILLGITNLLPIPALDGGRIVFVLVEMVRGRPVTPEREGLVHLIGLAFLLALGMIVILNDIINPVPSIIR